MKPLSITFLGTCSGGGPLLSRACTATALTFDSFSWLVDCAEGTQSQILKTPHLRIGKFDKIFITHLHVDHVMGLIPLLRSSMYSASPFAPQPRLQIYGPPGLRQFVRFNLNMTSVSLNGQYAVHEFVNKGENSSVGSEKEELHENEIAGRDFIPDEDGLWREVVKQGEWSVDVGPIVHRTRCLGYVFHEAPSTSTKAEVYIPAINANSEALVAQGTRYPLTLLKTLLKDRKPLSLPDGTVLEPPELDIPGRKLVILGDTSDPSAMKEIAMDASLLVHESTNGWMPPEISDKIKGLGGKGGKESVRAKAVGRGHSTAEMAGEFAKVINARRLYLNHFSTRFAPGGLAPPSPKGKGKSPRHFSPSSKARQEEARVIMEELERQASEAWGVDEDPKRRAIAAYDLLTVEIPTHEVQNLLDESVIPVEGGVVEQSTPNPEDSQSDGMVGLEPATSSNHNGRGGSSRGRGAAGRGSSNGRGRGMPSNFRRKDQTPYNRGRGRGREGSTTHSESMEAAAHHRLGLGKSGQQTGKAERSTYQEVKHDDN